MRLLSSESPGKMTFFYARALGIMQHCLQLFARQPRQPDLYKCRVSSCGGQDRYGCWAQAGRILHRHNHRLARAKPAPTTSPLSRTFAEPSNRVPEYGPTTRHLQRLNTQPLRSNPSNDGLVRFHHTSLRSTSTSKALNQPSRSSLPCFLPSEREDGRGWLGWVLGLGAHSLGLCGER